MKQNKIKSCPFHLFNKVMIIIAICFFSVSITKAQTSITPSLGDGTKENPYQLSTLNHIYWLSQTVSEWTKYFILTDDIDASNTKNWDSGMGFSPIGKGGNKFTGNFNGKGHFIKNLFINRIANYTGFFGYASKATIDSISMINVFISGYDRVGGIVGKVEFNSKISNCKVTGKTKGSSYVGGIIGDNEAMINNCSSSASVEGTNYVGGLVGENSATISNCHATGLISGSSYTGGLVGNNHGTINYSFATGSVYGSAGVGGFIGNNYANISYCYATGLVSGTNYVGGFAGDNISIINYCYATGIVSSSGIAGGLIGMNEGSVNNCYATTTINGKGTIGGIAGANSGGQLNNSYWDITSSKQTKGYGTNNYQYVNCSGLSTSFMKKQSNLSNLGDFQTIWCITEDQTYPTLRNIDNAPFAFSDTINSVSNTVNLSILLANDYDYETLQNNLILKIEKTQGNVSQNIYSFVTWATGGYTDTLVYRAGEIRPILGDTLWGNRAIALITKKVSTAIKTTKEDDIILYPNPCKDKFYINSSYKSALIEICNMAGKLLKTQYINGLTYIDVSDLKSGVYIINIDNKIFKLIIQK